MKKKRKRPTPLAILSDIAIIDRILTMDEVENHRNHACLHYERCLTKAEEYIRDMPIKSRKSRGYANLNYSFTCRYCNGKAKNTRERHNEGN